MDSKVQFAWIRACVKSGLPVKNEKKKEWACTIMVIFRFCKRVCQHVDDHIT